MEEKKIINVLIIVGLILVIVGSIIHISNQVTLHNILSNVETYTQNYTTTNYCDNPYIINQSYYCKVTSNG